MEVATGKSTGDRVTTRLRRSVLHLEHTSRRRTAKKERFDEVGGVPVHAHPSFSSHQPPTQSAHQTHKSMDTVALAGRAPHPILAAVASRGITSACSTLQPYICIKPDEACREGAIDIIIKSFDGGMEDGGCMHCWGRWARAMITEQTVYTYSIVVTGGESRAECTACACVAGRRAVAAGSVEGGRERAVEAGRDSAAGAASVG